MPAVAERSGVAKVGSGEERGATRMKRGAGGDCIAPEGGAVAVIREFLARLGDRRPTQAELRSIRPSLEALYERLMRVRSRGPAFRRVDFDRDIWRLMERIGKKSRPASGSSLGRAASFL